VLWNDISWPQPTPKLAGLLADYYRAVPDGVVNDRFMPRSPAWVAGGTRPGRWLLDTAAARSAKAEAGIVPPKPPLFDVRTPEYTTFDQIQGTPWECVRGIDASFGHNEQSDEADFLSRRDLLWSWVDIVAKGGNLLLNVGPRGRDAQIAPAQLRRLDWLAEFVGGGGDALFATRPWVTAGDGPTSGAGSGAGVEERYAAVDRRLVVVARAIEGAAPVDRLALPEVAATSASTATTADGRPLAFEAGPGGLAVSLDGPLDAEAPTVVLLDDVTPAPGAAG
jgi:alpha-L-fucosidase